MKVEASPDLHAYEFESNPEPTLTWLRENDPVHLSRHGYWFITRFDDVKMILGDHKTFSSRNAGFGDSNPIGKESADVSGKGSGEEKRISQSLSVSFNQQDQPDHARVRKLVVKAFSRKEISERGDRIKEVAAQLLVEAKQKAQATGNFDLVSDFAFHLPIMVACEIIGIPTLEREKFRLAFEHIERLMAPKKSDEQWQESLLMSRWLGKYIKALIEERAENPKDDLISALNEVSENQDQLDKREIISAIMTIFTAAGTTTERLISSGVFLLLRHPEQLAALRAKPDMLDSALEEILRYHHPNQSTSTNRRAVKDVALRGKTIKAGDTIRVSLGAANRDPENFDAANEFNIFRADNKHKSFGFGIHSCLGASLARAEAKAAIEALLLSKEDLQLLTTNPVSDPDRPDRYREVLVKFD